MSRVKLYKTPTCPYCNQVKEFFDKNNVAYDEVDVSKSEEAKEEMIEKSGQLGVPVTDIDGEIVTGYNKQKLGELLNV